MKTVFLVIYLYTKWGYSGAPVLEIHAMPNLETCRTVGENAKRLAVGNGKSGTADVFNFDCVESQP